MKNKDDIPTIKFADENYEKDFQRFLSCESYYLCENYRNPGSESYKDYWKRILKEEAKVDGLVLEFGVYNGNSINCISSLLEQKVFGFDCWSGLPEKWRSLEKGTFSTERPTVNENVKLLDGLFCDSIPKFLEQTEDKVVSVVHVDCDLYSSTMDIFANLHRYFVEGTIIAFDEFALWKGFEENCSSEFLALVDASKKYKFKYEYILRGQGKRQSAKEKAVIKII